MTADLIGQRFGKLVVIHRADQNDKHKQAIWVCKCDCGNMTTAITAKLRNGSKVSCGCWRNRRNGESRTRLFVIWRNMLDRCSNPKRDNFVHYGGRGIRVCNAWHEFEAFKAWALANGYADSLSIDRIDGDGNYEPGNCRWVTQKEQMQNVSNNRHIYYMGKQYTVSQFADLLCVPTYTIRNHLRADWSPERMVQYHAGL